MTVEGSECMSKMRRRTGGSMVEREDMMESIGLLLRLFCEIHKIFMPFKD